jgi:NDP-sugar pyrophosphorylase family protein
VVGNLQGAIIAAGRGERLRSSTGDVPKPLVTLGGRTLIARQALMLLGTGASDVIAVVNSETARLIEEHRVELPVGLNLIVRDTANSMESLFALGERLAPGHFVLATVDAVIPRGEMERFVSMARAMTSERAMDGALGVVAWRGDERPLFAEVSEDDTISRLGGAQARTVTAGVYYLPQRIFGFVADARAAGLAAMRQFLGMLLDKGLRLGAIELTEAIDVDEASDLEAARATMGDKA